MDPAVVSSEQFGFLFRTPLPGRNFQGGPEQVFASPLVYTASDGVQYVYVATTMNNIYKIDAKKGNIVASRNLARPFLQTDLQTCTDISPVIGSTATGVIDPATGTWYLTVKTYVDQSPSGDTGRPNGRYQIHAVSTDDLSENPLYPIDPEYTVARNNPLRTFTAGIHHQRPGLLQFKNFIYLGFASHCIQYNYTGWIMGFDTNTANLVEAYAMEGAGVGSSTSGAGVWMSGGGLASNGVDSIYWSTGNGQAAQLDQSPVSGRQPPTSLEEAAVHAAVNSDGTITIVDFFMPWEKVQLDGADKDLGTSPLQLLPDTFSCGNVQRIGMVTGKSGKTYWLNMDDMGGYRNGPNRLDNVIQMYQHENSVYAVSFLSLGYHITELTRNTGSWRISARRRLCLRQCHQLSHKGVSIHLPGRYAVLQPSSYHHGDQCRTPERRPRDRHFHGPGWHRLAMGLRHGRIKLKDI
jgi:hypothetical protein